LREGGREEGGRVQVRGRPDQNSGKVALARTVVSDIYKSMLHILSLLRAQLKATLPGVEVVVHLEIEISTGARAMNQARKKNDAFIRQRATVLPSVTRKHKSLRRIVADVLVKSEFSVRFMAHLSVHTPRAIQTFKP